MSDLFEFSEAELIELGVQDPPPPPVIITLDMTVELPHPDADLLCVRSRHDGQWDVSMRDKFGVGVGSTVSATGPTPLSASRSCHARLLDSIASRKALQAERESRSV